MIEAFIRKLQHRDTLSEAEESALRNAIAGIDTYPADTDMVRDGDRPPESSLLVDGYAARYKLLADGSRQITAIHIPGDFVDLHSFLIKKMDHGVVALTPCRAAKAPHERLREITEREPHLARLLWFSTLIDAAIFREWLVGVGRRSALGRMAHLFCELLLRHRVSGLANGVFPPSRHAAGTRRRPWFVLSACQPDGAGSADGELITWRDGRVTIHDFTRLAEVAVFDQAYLSLQNERR